MQMEIHLFYTNIGKVHKITKKNRYLRYYISYKQNPVLIHIILQLTQLEKNIPI